MRLSVHNNAVLFMPCPGCREGNFMAQLWWCTSAMPALWRSKREGQKFMFIHWCNKYVIQGQFRLRETIFKDQGVESWLRC